MNLTLNFRRLLLVVFAGIFIGNAQAELRTVALTGNAPGAQPDQFFSSFSEISINDLGRVSFEANLQNTAGTQGGLPNGGIWTDATGPLQLVALRDLMLGADPVFAPWTNDVHITNDRTTVFQGCDNTEAASSTGIRCTSGLQVWDWNNGILTDKIDDSFKLPGASGSSMREDILEANRNGTVLFQATLEDLSSGIWTVGPDGARQIAMYGQDVPTPSGENLELQPTVGSSSFSSDKFLGTSEAVAFEGVAGPDRLHGVWVRENDATRPIAIQGQVLDGMDGLQFSTRFNERFVSIQLSDRGDVVFRGVLQDSDKVDGLNDDVIFSASSDGEFRVVAREGAPAPGGGVFAVHSVFDNELASNSVGDVAFQWRVFGSGNFNNVFVDRGEGLELVSSASSSVDSVAINDNQQVAFATSRQITAESPTGQLIDVVATGDQIEVAPGDLRTVQSVSFDGNAAFNASGQIAFTATFEDGSRGVFVSNAVMVPEPSSLSLLISFAALAAACARRTRSVRSRR